MFSRYRTPSPLLIQIRLHPHLSWKKKHAAKLKRSSCTCRRLYEPVILNLKLYKRRQVCGVKLSGFISVLFDLSSEIQSLDFVKDVSGLLNPLHTLFLPLSLCHPLSTFLSALLSVSLSFFSLFLSLCHSITPSLLSFSTSTFSSLCYNPKMNQTFLNLLLICSRNLAKMALSDCNFMGVCERKQEKVSCVCEFVCEHISRSNPDQQSRSILK